MTRMGPMLTALAAIALGGCAGSGDARDDPRPPAPIVLTASISEQRISVSPRRFGAGPLSLIVVNQTHPAQRVTLESADRPGAGPGLKQETAPISPRDTATLKADVPPGRYSLH